MSVEPFLGRWWVAGASSKNLPPELAAIQDVEFSLLESGDVIWENTKERGDPEFPLFSCSTYQVLRISDCLTVSVLLRFSAWRGNVIEFRVDHDKAVVPRCMYLTLDGWCTLQCFLVRSVEEPRQDFCFSFLKVLELSEFNQQNTYFDIFVNQQIREKLLDCEVSVRDVILHYLHTHSLPTSVSLELVERVLQYIIHNSILKDLEELCRSFTKSSALQQTFLKMVCEIHGSVDQVLVLLGGKVLDANGLVCTPRNKSTGRAVMHNPPRLGAIQKQTIKKIVFVILKIVQFCVRFEEEKDYLSRADKNRVVMFAKSRVVIFVRQLLELLKSLKYATADLNTLDRLELAAYFVPEIEEVGYVATNLGLAIKELLELIVQKTAVTREGRTNGLKTMRSIVVGKEVLAMSTVSDYLGVLFAYLIQEREGFVAQSDQEKIRDLGRQLEQVINEIPLLVLHTEKLVQNLQEEQSLDDQTFLFNFTGFSSQIAAVLENAKEFQKVLRITIEIRRHQ